MEENDTGYLNNDGIYVIGRKSWVSYISIFFALGCYCLIFYSLIYFDLFNSIDSFFILNTGVNISIVSTLFILICIYYLYSIIVLRSFKLFMTDSGVFYEFGIFPWSKRGDGIHWKDIDMTFTQNNFFSWVTNSYTISVKHKFTNTTDFSVDSIWQGKNVANKIYTEQLKKT